MKRILIFLFLSSIVFGQENDYPILIEVSPRVISNNRVLVEVKIQNNTHYSVEKLEGFIFETATNRKTISEKRLIIIGPGDPALKPGFTVSKQKIYAHDSNHFREYLFHVGKLKFSGDYRIYTYHPEVGLIRVD